MSKKDVIISTSQGYGWDEIKLWANSITQSGFDGDAYLILYDGNPDIEEKLAERRIRVFHPKTDHLGNQNLDVLIDRFYQKWLLLNEIGYKNAHRVISTDLHDVIFQANPTPWLDSHLGEQKLFVSSEGIAYKDESWGAENFSRCFGEKVWASGIAENTIFNCGVWGGLSEHVAEMFLLIYLIGYGHPLHSDGSDHYMRWTDQATLNLLVSFELLRSQIKFFKSEDGFAAQLGTIGNPEGKYSGCLNEPEPFYRDGTVFTAKGEKYLIVHQYNRIAELNDQVRSKFATTENSTDPDFPPTLSKATDISGHDGQEPDSLELSDRLRRENQALVKRLEDIYSSRSWKITAPLRLILGRLGNK